MTAGADPSAVAGYCLIGGLILAGLIALGLGLRTGGWLRRPGTPPQPWIGGVGDLFVLLFAVVLGALAIPNLAGYLFRGFWVHHYEAVQLLRLGGFQVGITAGIAAYHFFYKPLLKPGSPGKWFWLGVGALVAAYPVVMGTSLVWQGLLRLCGVPVEQQETIDIFNGLTSIGAKSGFVFFAVILAPINEELVFRAGIYRGLRSRVPRWVAVWVSALLFGCAHFTGTDALATLVPLIVFGAVLAEAYERTGRIGVVIVAHALFNLATLAAISLGVSTP